MRMRDGSRIVRCPRPVETFDHRVFRDREIIDIAKLMVDPMSIQVRIELTREGIIIANNFCSNNCSFSKMYTDLKCLMCTIKHALNPYTRNTFEDRLKIISCHFKYITYSIIVFVVLLAM